MIASICLRGALPLLASFGAGLLVKTVYDLLTKKKVHEQAINVLDMSIYADTDNSYGPTSEAVQTMAKALCRPLRDASQDVNIWITHMIHPPKREAFDPSEVPDFGSIYKSVRSYIKFHTTSLPKNILTGCACAPASVQVLIGNSVGNSADFTFVHAAPNMAPVFWSTGANAYLQAHTLDPRAPTVALEMDELPEDGEERGVVLFLTTEANQYAAPSQAEAVAADMASRYGLDASKIVLARLVVTPQDGEEFSGRYASFTTQHLASIVRRHLGASRCKALGVLSGAADVVSYSMGVALEAVGPAGPAEVAVYHDAIEAAAVFAFALNK